MGRRIYGVRRSRGLNHQWSPGRLDESQMVFDSVFGYLHPRIGTLDGRSECFHVRWWAFHLGHRSRYSGQRRGMFHPLAMLGDPDD